MTAPQRIQRKRTKGWRMPRDTVSVTRPGKYGNPYFDGCGIGFGNFDEQMRPVHWETRTPEGQVRCFREHMRVMKLHQPMEYAVYLAPLAGKNLACWCKPEAPFCHADVLLELANA